MPRSLEFWWEAETGEFPTSPFRIFFRDYGLRLVDFKLILKYGTKKYIFHFLLI
jgi:hypothetical protein